MLILLTLMLGNAFAEPPAPAQATSANPVSVTVVLSNGDRLSGPIVSQDEDSITIDHSVLGHVKLPKVGPLATPPPADAGVEDGLPSTPVLVTSVHLPKPTPIWTGKVGLSLNYTDNIETTINARLSGELHKKTKAQKFDLQAWYLLIRDDGEITQSQAFVDASQNWLLKDSKWLYFLDGQYLYNSNQAWEHMASPNAGVGYRFLDTDDYALTGKFGGGFRWEYALNSVDPQLFLRVDGSVNLSASQSFNGFLQLTPAVDNFGNTQGILQLNYSMQMDFSPPVSLSFFLQDNFETMPKAGSTANDITAGVGIEYAF